MNVLNHAGPSSTAGFGSTDAVPLRQQLPHLVVGGPLEDRDVGARTVERLRRLVGDVAVVDQQGVRQTAQSSPTRAVPNMSVRRSMS